MIISASRRTDIPAFFGKWFMNRLKAQEVLVRNPMNSNQVTRIQLTPENVEAIVFWTKDPANFLQYLDTIHEMGYVFEELIRIGAEQSNEEAGEHFTPREVIKLMVNLLLSPETDLRKAMWLKPFTTLRAEREECSR